MWLVISVISVIFFTLFYYKGRFDGEMEGLKKGNKLASDQLRSEYERGQKSVRSTYDNLAKKAAEDSQKKLQLYKKETQQATDKLALKEHMLDEIRNILDEPEVREIDNYCNVGGSGSFVGPY